MYKKLNIPLFFALLVFLGSCSDQDRGCGESPYSLNAACEAIRWKSLPVTLEINGDTPQSVRNAVYAAEEIWETQLNSNVFEIKEVSSSSDPTNLIATVYGSGWAELGGSEDQNGRTTFLYRGNEMIQANVYFNGDLLNTTQNGQTIDLVSVALHELGHVLGLAHNNNSSSLMYAKIAYGELKMPTQEDLQN
ncbi:MAG TPA: matrixin family metalloprotease, partial [Bdellovibrionota bacterium]|nr:matrixin family metalloprotease [Bdellovibrionota bacterium]